MANKILYDPRCLEVAEHFIELPEGDYRRRCVDDLAGRIQEAVEAWFAEQEAAASPVKE